MSDVQILILLYVVGGFGAGLMTLAMLISLYLGSPLLGMSVQKMTPPPLPHNKDRQE